MFVSKSTIDVFSKGKKKNKKVGRELFKNNLEQLNGMFMLKLLNLKALKAIK